MLKKIIKTENSILICEEMSLYVCIYFSKIEKSHNYKTDFKIKEF